MQIKVVRWFPTYDFIIQTTASPEEVSLLIFRAMCEPAEQSWLLREPQISGRIAQNKFSGRTRSRGWSSLFSGQISATPSGSELTIRVINWCTLVFFGVWMVPVFHTIAHIKSSSNPPYDIFVCVHITLILSGLYWQDSLYVRKLFMRIISSSTSGS
jgi:hypothetical protein